MALIEGIGDDVTVTVLLFIGVLTFYLWKVCFSSLRSYHDLPPRQTEVARSHSLDSSRVGEGETRVEQPRVDDDERETGEGVEGTPSEDVDGTIVVKLRHQETERVARVRRDQTVEELKRIAFAQELASGCRVRFVYRGRLMHDENHSLSFYEIQNNSVIIVAITGSEGSGSPERLQAAEFENPEFDMSRFFFPLVFVIVIVVWVVALSTPALFSTSAWVMLVVLSAGFGFLAFNSRQQAQRR